MFRRDGAAAIILQSDNKIVAVGSSTDNFWFSYDFALARYNPDGSLDGDFGTDGKVMTDFAGSDYAQAVALQQDGKILVSGVSDGSSILVRYNPDGSLDETFGVEGEASGSSGSGGRTGTVSGALNSGRSLAVQYDGMILLGGASGNDFGLARYTEAGELDASFGAGGVVTTDFGGIADQLAALSLQQDGKAVAAGVTDVNGTNDFAAARYFAAPEPKQVYLPVVRR